MWRQISLNRDWYVDSQTRTVQGCQMVYFQTKNANIWANFGRPYMEWQILGYFMVI
jgi:hypothetical protein